MSGSDIERLAARLLRRYVRALDDDRLEDWVDCFVEDCSYKVLSIENVKRGLPFPLIQYENKNMLRDRVLALRRGNLYNLHYARHITSDMDVDSENGVPGLYRLQASYLVLQTDMEGETKLFSTGRYDAQVVFDGDVVKFKELTVIVDTFSVPNLISIPL